MALLVCKYSSFKIEEMSGNVGFATFSYSRADNISTLCSFRKTVLILEITKSDKYSETNRYFLSLLSLQKKSMCWILPTSYNILLQYILKASAL